MSILRHLQGARAEVHAHVDSWACLACGRASNVMPWKQQERSHPPRVTARALHAGKHASLAPPCNQAWSTPLQLQPLKGPHSPRAHPVSAPPHRIQQRVHHWELCPQAGHLAAYALKHRALLAKAAADSLRLRVQVGVGVGARVGVEGPGGVWCAAPLKQQAAERPEVRCRQFEQVQKRGSMPRALIATTAGRCLMQCCGAAGKHGLAAAHPARPRSGSKAAQARAAACPPAPCPLLHPAPHSCWPACRALAAAGPRCSTAPAAAARAARCRRRRLAGRTDRVPRPPCSAAVGTPAGRGMHGGQ